MGNGTGEHFSVLFLLCAEVPDMHNRGGLLLLVSSKQLVVKVLDNTSFNHDQDRKTSEANLSLTKATARCTRQTTVASLSDRDAKPCLSVVILCTFKKRRKSFVSVLLTYDARCIYLRSSGENPSYAPLVQLSHQWMIVHLFHLQADMLRTTRQLIAWGHQIIHLCSFAS